MDSGLEWISGCISEHGDTDDTIDDELSKAFDANLENKTAHVDVSENSSISDRSNEGGNSPESKGFGVPPDSDGLDLLIDPDESGVIDQSNESEESVKSEKNDKSTEKRDLDDNVFELKWSYRPFTIPKQILRSTAVAKSTSILSQFLPEVLMLILKDYNLDMVDRICLALTSKELAQKVTTLMGTMEYSVRNDDPGIGVLGSDLVDLLPRLGPKSGEKLCVQCFKFQRLDIQFWIQTLSNKPSKSEEIQHWVYAFETITKICPKCQEVLLTLGIRPFSWAGEPLG